MENREDKKLYEVMISLAVSKATQPAVHKTLINWGMRASGAEYISHKMEFDFARPYITELKKYGTLDWKNGNRAQLQATAFVEYLLDSKKEVRNQWLLCGIQNIFGYSYDNIDQRRNVFGAFQKELRKSYPKETIEHFRTIIVGYQTLWERTVSRLKTRLSDTFEFTRENLIGVIITIAIILVVVVCWTCRSNIYDGGKYLWNKLPALPSRTQSIEEGTPPAEPEPAPQAQTDASSP
jgi:hypothetical protein